MKKLFFLFIMILSSICSLNAQQIIYNEYSEPITMNPLNIVDPVSGRLVDLFFNRLVGKDITGQPVPELLEKLEPVFQSPDRTHFTYQLRKDVRWSNGELFTAEDVEFTFNAILNPQTDTNLKKFLLPVEELKANPINPYLIEVTMKYSVYTNPLVYLSFPIVPKSAFTKDYISRDDKFGRSVIVGTGPYIFKGWEGGTIKMSRNRNYFKKPKELPANCKYIENILMTVNRDPLIAVNSLLNGTIQVVPDLPVSSTIYAQIKDNKYCSLKEYNTRGFSYFAYNCKHPFLKDKRVRQALTLAFDRKGVLKKYFGTKADERWIAHGPLPADQSCSDIMPLPYDVDKAKKLLKSAGFSDTNKNGIIDKDGKDFIVTLKVADDTEFDKRIYFEYQKALKQIGIKLENDQPIYLSKRNWVDEVMQRRNFDIAYGSWQFKEEINIIDDLFTSDGANNFVGYENSEVDLLAINLEAGRIDPASMIGIYCQLDRIISDDCPYTFLYNMPKQAGIRSDVLKNVQIHDYYFFGYIWDCYLAQ